MTAQREPSIVLKDIQAKTKMILHLQRRADRGEFKSVGDALALQRTIRERKQLMDELPPLRLVD